MRNSGKKNCRGKRDGSKKAQKSKFKDQKSIIIYKKMVSFGERVYEIVRKIPRGRVATYGQVAKLAGSPLAARAVGMCMKKNTDIPKTPCHRVVASDGKLTGYSAGKGVSSKKQMLVEEGVFFTGDKVDMTKSLWRDS